MSWRGDIRLLAVALVSTAARPRLVLRHLPCCPLQQSATIEHHRSAGATTPTDESGKYECQIRRMISLEPIFPIPRLVRSGFSRARLPPRADRGAATPRLGCARVARGPSRSPRRHGFSMVRRYPILHDVASGCLRGRGAPAQLSDATRLIFCRKP